ncbi:MAG: fumarylacetoacetase [Planctomycetota bacterium]
MPYEIDETHDPSLESWVESANDPETDFPIQNLPFVAFHPGDNDPDETFGVRIGDSLLDLQECYAAGLLDDLKKQTAHPINFVFRPGGDMAALCEASRDELTAIRRAVSALLADRAGELGTSDELRARCLMPVQSSTPLRYTEIGDYTDFYASIHHATNVGSMFRPDNPLLPNYPWIPVGYHGRASSVVPSGTAIRRPVGQQAPAEDGGTPSFGPSKLLDYELEMGIVIGRGNELGEPISIDNAEDHILGMCLLNDWSARDLQKWEYVPLGPFLAKSFASTVSPYIVTMEALAPFRVPAYERGDNLPQPLPHLDSDHNRAHGAVDVTLEVYLSSQRMRDEKIEPMRISTGSYRHMLWTPAQMVTHHTSNGCNLQPGDLLGSGTVSGPKRENRGCLLELTWDGDPWAEPPVMKPGTERTPIVLPTGEERKFLADGDEVILKGFCEREGYRRIGFGECRGIITPARA